MVSVTLVSAAAWNANHHWEDQEELRACQALSGVLKKASKEESENSRSGTTIPPHQHSLPNPGTQWGGTGGAVVGKRVPGVPA